MRGTTNVGTLAERSRLYNRSMYNPQANGQAESGVAIAEKILKQDDPIKALMIYRSTKVQSTGCSPSKLLMGR